MNNTRRFPTFTTAVHTRRLVAGTTHARVVAQRVPAHGAGRTRVLVAGALVDVLAVKGVDAPEAGQALARVVAHLVDAARVLMAVIAVGVALLGALVDVCASESHRFWSKWVRKRAQIRNAT